MLNAKALAACAVTLCTLLAPLAQAADQSTQYARCAGEYWAWAEMTSKAEVLALGPGVLPLIKGSFYFKAATSGLPSKEVEGIARRVQEDRRREFVGAPADEGRWADWGKQGIERCDAMPNPLKNGVEIADKYEFLWIWSQHSDGPADLRKKVAQRVTADRAAGR